MPVSDPADGDAGSALILAMIFLLVTAVLLTPLTGIVANAFSSTSSLNNEQVTQYAAEGTTEAAIQAVRYSPDSYATTAECLPGGVASLSVGASAPSMEAYCSGSKDTESTATRVVTFSTCVSGTPAAQCTAAPLVVATVTFNDFSLTNQDQCLTVPVTTTSCGSGITVDNWTVELANS